jgi:hypothetical protein
LTSQGNRSPVGPEIICSSSLLVQGCALRWVNAWAFGPQIAGFSSRNGKLIVPLTVRQILDEQIAMKLA